MLASALAAALLALTAQPCAARDLLRHVRAIADDSLSGREPGTLGDTRTTKYLADELQRSVAASGGRVSLQRFALRRTRVTSGRVWLAGNLLPAGTVHIVSRSAGPTIRIEAKAPAVRIVRTDSAGVRARKAANDWTFWDPAADNPAVTVYVDSTTITTADPLAAVWRVDAIQEEAGVETHNVIATIPGTRDGWVVVMAHHDGLGVGVPDATGDSIYNGAQDNAVGVALAVCLAQAAGREGRGLVVVLTAAEERGKLGAKYWVRQPGIDLARVHLAVNLDAIGVGVATEDYIAYGNADLVGAEPLLRDAGSATGFDLSTPSFESSMRNSFDAAVLGAAAVPAVTVGQGMRRPSGVATPKLSGRFATSPYHAPHDEVAEHWNWDTVRRYLDLAAAVVGAARTRDGAIRVKDPTVYRP